VTGWPSDQRYGLSWIVAVVWSPADVIVAGSARLCRAFSPTDPGPPNQYSGRHMRYSEYSMFAPVASSKSSSGRM
jgi:hypothetical protein